MFSRSEGSSFGRRLRRATLVFAVPLVLAALAVGHYRTCAAACRSVRPSLADANAQRIVDFMKVSVRTSARYFWGSTALGAALLREASEPISNLGLVRGTRRKAAAGRGCRGEMV